MTGTKHSENVGSGNSISALTIMSIYFKRYLNCELNITKDYTVLYYQESIFLLLYIFYIFLLLYLIFLHSFVKFCLSMFSMFSPVNIH